jgi:membrane protein
MSAALAFYAILSLVPVLIVVTAVAGLGFWQKMAETEALRQIQAVVGETSARVLHAAILDANRPALGVIASVVGVGTMMLGASGAFVELHDALNKIWKVERKSGGIFPDMFRQRFLSFSLVLGTGVLLLLSLLSSAAIEAAEKFISHQFPWPAFFLKSADFFLSFGVITMLLAVIFKLLPDTEIAWNDVWIGAAIAALLFTIGKVLLGLYLGGSAIASVYGLVSSPLVFLVWIYCSAQMILFGGEIAHIYANKHGSRTKSASNNTTVRRESISSPISSPWLRNNGL